MQLADRLVAEFALPPATRLERSFRTELGHPKHIFELRSGARCFAGSTPHVWPARNELERTLAWLNGVAAALALLDPRVRVGPYARTVGGTFVVDDEQSHHWFLRPLFDGEELGADGGGRALLARAVGRFHEAWAWCRRTCFAALDERAHGAPARDVLRGSILRRLSRFEASSLATDRIATEDRATILALLPDGIERVLWLADHRGAALDSLPRALVHDDLQRKNLLIDAAPGGGEPTIAILDAESANLGPRAMDLYFVLMGGDDGAWLGDVPAFAEAVRAYETFAGPLTPEERRLLPNALQFKASGVAAWACSELAGGRDQGRYASVVARALGCGEWVHRHREELRDALG